MPNPYFCNFIFFAYTVEYRVYTKKTEKLYESAKDTVKMCGHNLVCIIIMFTKNVPMLFQWQQNWQQFIHYTRHGLLP